MNKETLYAERINFDESERQTLQRTAKAWRAFAAIGWVLAAGSIAAAASLAQLHEFVPVVASVDSHTGTADVRVGKLRVNVADPKNELMMIADVARYIKAREGFTRAEAQINYATVLLMSAPALRGAWDDEYKGERNPNALINKLTARDQIRPENLSITGSMPFCMELDDHSDIG